MQDRFMSTTEPPLKRVRYIDDWLQLHFKVIQRLVEEPMFAQPRIGEPTMEVCIVGANLWGPWPHPWQNMLRRPFVRHYIDTEMIGETKHWEGNPQHPRWEEKMLFLPRGGKISQFEILNDGADRQGGQAMVPTAGVIMPPGADLPLVLGDCALSTETLWTTAQNCGRYLLDLPILCQGNEVGKLQLQISMWNGRPLTEENPMMGAIGGTLAGAVDNDAFGPFANMPQPMVPGPLGPMGMPMSGMYNGYMQPPGSMVRPPMMSSGALI